MSRLKRLFQKIQNSYQDRGVPGLVDFTTWLFHLLLEKAILGCEARRPSWWPCIGSNHFHAPGRAFTPIDTQKKDPLVTFILPVDGSPSLVATTLRSLINQANPLWECILCRSGTPGPGSTQDKYPDCRITTVTTQPVAHVELLVNQLIPRVKGKWVVFTRPGDKQDPSLVDQVAAGQGSIIYWDEALYSGSFPYAPFLKPDWSPELWLSVDLLRCAAFKVTDLISLVKKDNDGFISTQIAATKQITHIPRILTLCRTSAWKDPAEQQQHLTNVNQYLNRMCPGKAQLAIRGEKGLAFSATPARGMVSIIIPTRNNMAVLRRCLHSIRQTPAGVDYEIILVDDQSNEPATLDYYQHIQQQHTNVRITHTQGKFNYSRACNLGALESKGKYLLFLNNDVEIIKPNWLNSMVAVMSLRGVGVVGAKLLYPNGRIQHAGIVLGLEGHASHVFLGSLGTKKTPFGSLDWYRNYMAVTGACMLVRRDVFTMIHGFDEAFELVFGDVDLCLRAGEKGYRIVYDPKAVLYHHEGRTRGRFNPEADILLAYDRFKKQINLGDPFYNPGLSRAWRIPVLRKRWEQDPGERIENIIKFKWF